MKNNLAACHLLIRFDGSTFPTNHHNRTSLLQDIFNIPIRNFPVKGILSLPELGR